MSSAKWVLVERDFESAAKHFAMASLIHEGGVPVQGNHQDYVTAGAFMHAVQSGHTSLENGLLRIFKTIGEAAPHDVGDLHDAVVRQAFEPVEGRGPILPTHLREVVDETRRARSLAMHAYERFTIDRADATAKAAHELSEALPDVLQAFIEQIDPHM